MCWVLPVLISTQQIHAAALPHRELLRRERVCGGVCALQDSMYLLSDVCQTSVLAHKL